jgi:hypothetical protein
MIRNRLVELDSAVTRAIEMLRGGGQVEAVAQGILELLGQAACSERAMFWAVDSELRNLRAIATWSAETSGASPPGSDSRYRTVSLSRSNAGHVWRSRKPLWSTSLVLDTAAPSAGEVGMRGGAWFAIKTDTSVYGVIELLGRALELTTPDNLGSIERLGSRLGHALEESRHGTARLRWGAVRRRGPGEWP